MVDPGARPSSWTSLALAIVLSLLAPACQSTVSVEGAKKITTQFGGAGFVPPAADDQRLTRASQSWRPGGSLKIYDVLYNRAMAELTGGSCSRHLEYRRRAIDAVPNSDRGWVRSS